MAGYREASERISPTSTEALKQAELRQLSLTKPPGALGFVEELGNRLAAIAERCPPPPLLMAQVVVFAGDHGVVREGVTPWPQEVTAQMVENFLSGGAAINVIARTMGASVAVCDIGVCGPVIEAPALVGRRIRSGTESIRLQSAMSLSEAEASLDLGVELADSFVEGGADVLITGDMGIGNTTPSAALIAAICQTEAENVVGRGTGVDDETLALKSTVIADSLDRVRLRHGTLAIEPAILLSELGGLEMGGIAGLILGAAARRVPVLLDGVISLAGALVALEINPLVREYCFAGHRSTEPAASVALTRLNLKPILELSMRLGEGTGATLALPVLRAASALLAEMATFGSAGVSEK